MGTQTLETGFNDSLIAFTKEYFARIRSFRAPDDEEFFENARRRVQSNLENFFRQQPYNQVYAYQDIILRYE